LLPVKEWRAFDEYLQPLIVTENSCPSSLENVQKQPELYMCCTNELNALKLLHRAQLAIQKCDVWIFKLSGFDFWCKFRT
jgi:hypothetical protein